jgi:putative chitinase
MKKKKTCIKLGIFLFGISLLLWNCEKEEINHLEQEHKTAEINYLNIDELPEVAFALSGINKKGFTKNKNTYGRSMQTDFGSLNLSNILEYANNDGKMTYSFLIDKETPKETPYVFENLHLVKLEEGYLGYILKWEPDKEWFQNNNYNFILQYFTGKYTHYDLEYNIIKTGNFINGQPINNTNRVRKSSKENKSMEMLLVCISSMESKCTGIPYDCGGFDPSCGFGFKTECSLEYSGGGAGGSDDSSNDSSNDDNNNNQTGGGTIIPGTTNSTDSGNDGNAIVVPVAPSLEDCGPDKPLNIKTGKCECPDGKVENSNGDCIDNPCAGGKVYNPATENCDCPVGKVEDSSGNCVKKCETTKEDLKKVFVNSSDADMTTLSAIINKYGKDFGIDTESKLQHFLSQAGHEVSEFSNGLSRTESLRYTTESRLKTIFKKYFWQNSSDTINKRNPADYLRNSSKVANYVYANRMTNGNEASGEGYKYRGRGIFQLTGKANYTAFKTWYNNKYIDNNKDFVTSPDLLTSNDTVSVISALWFYKTNVLDKITPTVDSTTTVKKVTKKVNGGKNGLSHRKEIFNKAKNLITCK